MSLRETSPMSRRLLFAPLLASLAAACSPIGLLNSLGPRDQTARRVSRDLSYGQDPRQRFDLFAPIRPQGVLPVVVLFYGGGWDSGAKADYAWAAQALAAQGFLVALPDYRLVPDVRFPAFIEDAAEATAAVGRIASEYGADPERLGVAGHSAGAHLAMMIALDRQYMQAAGAPDQIRAAAGLSGPYEFLPFNVPASVNAFGHVADPAQTQPVNFVRADAPPLWLGHGEPDVVVHAEDSVILAERTQAIGGRAELRLYPHLNHADTIATFSPLFRSKAPVLAEMAAFLHRELDRPRTAA